MGILLVGLDQLHDPMLDVVEGLRIAGWPILGSPCTALNRQTKIVRDAIDVEIEKHLRGRPIWMLGLAQQTQ